MTAEVDTARDQGNPEDAANGAVSDAAKRDTAQQLFRFSTWLHIGPNAENCADVNEEGGENNCGNPLHFHAWCRLPNQFRHREIREKAMAAKARRARQLRDSSTDAHDVLEGELDDVARLGEQARSELTDELVGKEWWRDYLEAVKDVGEEEGEDGLLYEHIITDRERYEELRALDPDKRPADEYEELERHVASYDEKVKGRVEQLQAPRRQALADLDLNALIDEVRGQRIEQNSTQEFMHTYSRWEWFYCTLRAPRGERVFADLEAMDTAPEEVIDGLQATFADLEQTKQRGALGNP